LTPARRSPQWTPTPPSPPALRNSLRGCYFKLASPFPVETRALVKIFHDDQYFEAKSNVVHVQPASGMGVAFREIKPHCKSSLQKWILSALHDHNTEEASDW
jgi:hypothetical protein